MDTRFTRLVGCWLPFQLAALGGVGTTELAAAVTAGGGLGMVPYGVKPPATELGPCGIGFLIPYLPSAGVIAEAAGTVRVVEFFQGDPDESLVAAGHSGGALVSWQVGSVGEGRAAQAAGCDLVVQPIAARTVCVLRSGCRRNRQASGQGARRLACPGPPGREPQHHAADAGG